LNTYSHALQTMAAARRLYPGDRALARTAAIGAALPDLPYLARAAALAARRRGKLTRADIITALDYDGVPSWAPDLALHSLASLLPAAIMAGLPASPRTRAHLRALIAGLAGHAVTDLLTHRTDARPVLWPLSQRRWHSPVSCWDRRAHAVPVTVAEHLLTAVAVAMIAQQGWQHRHSTPADAQQPGRRAGELATFATRFLAHPAQMGAITPTSQRAVAAMLSMTDLSDARLIIEIGAGTGAFTQGLLRRAPGDARIIAFEIDPHLAARLRSRFDDDKRLTVIADSAEHMRCYLDGRQADTLVSAVPLTSMPPAVRNAILAEAAAVLRPEGTMLAIQYSPARQRDLTQAFSAVRRRWVAANIPPAFLYACTGPAGEPC
jgi:phospholipid N-methyltransferase